jgi:hypothetical protein
MMDPKENRRERAKRYTRRVEFKEEQNKEAEGG